MKTKFIILPLIALGFLFTGCVSQGDPVTDKKIVTLKEFDTIDISSQVADVTVIQEERDDISITLSTYENGPRLKVEENGDTLNIDAKKKDNRMNVMSFYNSPTLKIYIPVGYQNDLVINNSSGNVTLRNIHLKDLDLDLSSGNIEGNDIDVATCSVNNSSGNVVLEDMICKTIKTDLSSGNLTLKNFAGEIDGNSSSGNTTIQIDQLINDITYSSSSGNVKVTLNAEDINANFDLSCSSGNVDVMFDLDDYGKNKENSVKGSIGTGDVQVDIHVSSGDITIKE